MKYVIFLDIDGVLNSRGYHKTDEKYLEYKKTTDEKSYRNDTRRFMKFHMDPSAVRKLRFLVEELQKKGDTEIWISSSWGRFYTVKEIAYSLKIRGMGELSKVVKGITPRKMSSYRCNEVGWGLLEIAETYKGPIRWMVIDNTAVFDKSYVKDIIYGHYQNESFRVEYNPEYRTDTQNGLTYTDVLAILTMMTPGFQPDMEPL